MKIIKNNSLLVCSLFTLMLVVGCKDDNNISVVTNFDNLNEKKLHIGDKLPIEFSTGDTKVDSYTIDLNGKTYNDKNDITLDSTNAKRGQNYLVLNLKYGDKTKRVDAVFDIYSQRAEKKMNYKILQTYPHNTELFTQGFTYKDGVITESAGEYGKSKLVRYPLGSTTYTQEEKIDPKVFAEGFSLLDGKLYLLSYKERTVFVYNAATFEQEKTIPYPAIIIEGWGATTIGNDIVISDSSSDLKFFDENFNLKRMITVVGEDKVYPYVNELEYANGYIYANVFGQDLILVIDPKTGEVVAKAEFPELVKENQKDAESVLNGIAHVSGNTFLITGKNWSKIYKVELSF